MTTAHAAHPHRPPASGFPRLRHFFLEYLLALPLGAGLALTWSAIDPASYYRFATAAAFPVNDVALLFFFGLITKEVVEATRPGGALHPWRRAALPLVASFAATVLTLAMFRLFVRAFGDPMLERGWASVLAVDVAFGYFVARVIFGRSAMVPFFLLVALAANAFAFAGLAASEPPRGSHPWPLIGLVGLAMAAAYGGRRRGVQNPWYYLLVAAPLAWLGLYLGGAPPALALLPVLPFVPARRRDPGFFVDADGHSADALDRVERLCRHPAQVALFLFGLANAGIAVPTLELGVFALPLATLIGRPLGLLLALPVARAIGLHLPVGSSAREIAVLGITTAVGFTMTLFIATAALGPGSLLMELRAGALLTVVSGAAAVATARLLHVGRFARHVTHSA